MNREQGEQDESDFTRPKRKTIKFGQEGMPEKVKPVGIFFIDSKEGSRLPKKPTHFNPELLGLETEEQAMKFLGNVPTVRVPEERTDDLLRNFNQAHDEEEERMRGKLGWIWKGKGRHT